MSVTSSRMRTRQSFLICPSSIKCMRIRSILGLPSSTDKLIESQSQTQNDQDHYWIKFWRDFWFARNDRDSCYLRQPRIFCHKHIPQKAKALESITCTERVAFLELQKKRARLDQFKHLLKHFCNLCCRLLYVGSKIKLAHPYVLKNGLCSRSIEFNLLTTVEVFDRHGTAGWSGDIRDPAIVAGVG